MPATRTAIVMNERLVMICLLNSSASQTKRYFTTWWAGWHR